MSAQLVGTAEIAELLGISKTRVVQLAERDDFPTPEQLACGRVWRRAQIERWARRHRPNVPARAAVS